MLPNKYVILCTIWASLSFFIIGYDDAVVHSIQSHVVNDLKISFRQYDMFILSTLIYEVLGSILAGVLADKLGRRYTITVCSMILLFGATWSYFSFSFTMLMLSRAVTGFSFGFGLTIGPVYVVELSPPIVRGFLGSFLEVLYNMGFILGYVMQLTSAIVYHLKWMILLSGIAIPSFVMMIATWWMVETPYWLLMKGRLTDATEVVHKCSSNSGEADELLASMRISFDVPIGATGNNVDIPIHIQGNNTLVWSDLFRPSHYLHKIFISIIGAHAFHQVAAAVTLIYLSSFFMIYGGLTDALLIQYAFLALYGLKALFSVFSIFMVDKIGRRPLLLVSIGTMIISLAILGTSLLTVNSSLHFSEVRTVVMHLPCVIMFVAAYSIGLGPIVWFYAAEVLPTRLRSKGTSIAGIVVNRMMCGFVLMISSYLYKWITYKGCFLVHATFLVPGFVFTYIYVRETMARNLDEEISE